jgi:hypothetical protein
LLFVVVFLDSEAWRCNIRLNLRVDSFRGRIETSSSRWVAAGHGFPGDLGTVVELITC